MSSKKFKFVSPGIFLSEVDNSQLPSDATSMGPVIIGRTACGPSMRPVEVSSFSDFVETFGNPVPGNQGGDTWRLGNLAGPTYAAYAAQAYLRAGVGPVTMIRLAGQQNESALTTGLAGWQTVKATASEDEAANGGAYGLYLMSGSVSGAALPACITGTNTGPYNLSAGDVLTLDPDTSTTTDCTFNATAGSETDATTYSGLPSQDGKQITVAVNGTAPQTITFSGATDTASVLAGQINSQITGASATVVAGQVKVTSDVKGKASTIAVSNIDSDLVWTNAPVPGAGTEDLQNIAAVTAAEIAAVINAAMGVHVEATVLASGHIKICGTTLGTSGNLTAAATTVRTALGFAATSTGTAASAANPTGSLAAIFYVNDGGGLALTGTLDDGSTLGNGSEGIFETSSTRSWKMEIYDTDGTSKKLTTEFNLDQDSNKFIRNVFNTNPMLVNGDIVDTAALGQGQNLYWLGESFESNISDAGLDTYQYATLIPLESGSYNRAEMKRDALQAASGWFFSQDLTTDTAGYAYDNMQKLFRFHALDGGDWSHSNLKISIKDLKYSRNTDPANAYGSFTVLVRQASDNDNTVQVIEQYTNCNLNPASDDYLGIKIGTTQHVWDTTENRLKELGEFSNKSKYIRVDINSEIASGRADARLLPFGVYGPESLQDISLELDGASTSEFSASSDHAYAGLNSFKELTTSATAVLSSSHASSKIAAGTTILLRMPRMATRLSASDGGISDPKNAYFGAKTTFGATLRHDAGYCDYLRPLPSETLPAAKNSQFIFTLDEVVTAGSMSAYAEPGSRKTGASTTAAGAKGWKAIIDAGYTRFTSPLFGGFEGVDIREAEPFRNTLLDGATVLDSYVYNTVKRAIDTVSDPEYTECNLITMPGLTEDTLTTHILTTCEDRADALALIDLEDVFVPETETVTSKDFDSRAQPVQSAIDKLEERQLNSSYGCTYYPWAQIRDSISGQQLWVPPSVVALGTLASSEAKSEIWFAPAGFNRGGLTEGSAGLSVLNVSRKLTSKNRDDLYEANINPIASFPSEGLVVFGQKTLQQTPSALDRINVRRMMLFVKKEISRISAGILFDQNVSVTWNRFLGQVEPFLAGVQSRLGLSDFKVILDETTTTPDLVDRNILYAKIYLKPARAIEFIAIDFVITRSGASFED